MPRTQYIDSNAALADAAECWEAVDAVAFDTEFIRTRTFYPIAALYQLATDQGEFLIDPLAIDDWSSLIELLVDARIVKIMHACSEDLEVFARHLGCAPAGIFDTQVAEGFLSTTYSPGYLEVVRRHTGVELAKHETRSDWLARPLSADQLRYAAEDVEYLLPVYRHQRAELDRLGRRNWFEAECRERCSPNPGSPETYYRGVSGAARLDALQLERLRRLCLWREQRARQRDLPRGRVVRDEELLELALVERPDKESLFRCLHAPAARRHWQELLALIEDAEGTPEHERPGPLPRPLNRVETRLVKELRDCAQARAEALGMAPELLSRRRELEACVRHFRDTAELSTAYRGWRHALVGEAFTAILAAGLEPRE